MNVKPTEVLGVPSIVNRRLSLWSGFAQNATCIGLLEKDSIKSVRILEYSSYRDSRPVAAESCKGAAFKDFLGPRNAQGQ